MTWLSLSAAHTGHAETKPWLRAFYDHVEQTMPFSPKISGYVRNRNYVRPYALDNPDLSRNQFHKNVENDYELRNDIRLVSDLTFTPAVTGRVSVDTQLDYGWNHDDFRTENTSIKPFEYYADFTRNAWDLRLGSQVISWGKSDEYNPVDNFTPEDFKEFLNLERAERKLPVVAAYLKNRISETWSWEGIGMPFFRENLIAESDQDWEFFFRRNYRKTLGFRAEEEDRPEKNLSNSVWATRFLHQGDLMDYSFSYAYHFDQNPAYKIHADPLFLLGATTSPGTIETVWEREHSVGFDFEIPKGEFGYRGEVVYTTHKPFVTEDTADGDFVEYKNVIDSVIGFDYSHGDYYFNLQYTQFFILDHEELMEPRAYESSIILKASRKFMHDKLEIEGLTRYFLTDVDFFYKIHAIYELRENFKMDIGYMVFEGEDLGIFGQYDTNDQAFLNFKYDF